MLGSHLSEALGIVLTAADSGEPLQRSMRSSAAVIGQKAMASLKPNPCWWLTRATAQNYYRRQAEECREQADRSRRAEDKAAWLRIAGEWLKLAQGVDQPASRRAGALPQRQREEAARGAPIMLAASSTITEGTALPGGGATPLHEPDQT